MVLKSCHFLDLNLNPRAKTKIKVFSYVINSSKNLNGPYYIQIDYTTRIIKYYFSHVGEEKTSNSNIIYDLKELYKIW